jgi:hypothetical protein
VEKQEVEQVRMNAPNTIPESIKASKTFVASSCVVPNQGRNKLRAPVARVYRMVAFCLFANLRVLVNSSPEARRQDCKLVRNFVRPNMHLAKGGYPLWTPPKGPKAGRKSQKAGKDKKAKMLAFPFLACFYQI